MHSPNQITFPVYRLRQYHEIKTDGKVIYINTYKGSYILDNKNIEGKFVQRRRKITSRKVYPLYNPIMTHRLLILDKNPNKSYIDSTGALFAYKKTKFVPLCWYWIKDKKYIGNKIIITAEDIPCKFEVSSTHRNVQAKYIGLLHMEGGYILYNLLKEKRKNSRLKI